MCQFLIGTVKRKKNLLLELFYLCQFLIGTVKLSEFTTLSKIDLEEGVNSL